ncbi:MAG TPA: hypothetical protein PLW50_00025 [Smithellaceae bacterium]|nr:hypothetical protein [Smithellaceae bacterium]
MIDGKINCAGIGIEIERVMEISFVTTPAELAVLSSKLSRLQVGDDTKVFEAEGTFEDKRVRFIVRLKQ